MCVRQQIRFYNTTIWLHRGSVGAKLRREIRQSTDLARLKKNYFSPRFRVADGVTRTVQSSDDYLLDILGHAWTKHMFTKHYL